MSFKNGFEKTALIGRIADKALKGVGKLIGGAVGTSAAISKRQMQSIHGATQAAKSGFTGAYTRGSRGWDKKQVGGYLAKHRGDESPKKIEEARKAIVARADSIHKARPGFAMKHPFITGLGAYGLGHALLGESKEEPEPQIYSNR